MTLIHLEKSSKTLMILFTVIMFSWYKQIVCVHTIIHKTIQTIAPKSDVYSLRVKAMSFTYSEQRCTPTCHKEIDNFDSS